MNEEEESFYEKLTNVDYSLTYDTEYKDLTDDELWFMDFEPNYKWTDPIEALKEVITRAHNEEGSMSASYAAARFIYLVLVSCEYLYEEWEDYEDKYRALEQYQFTQNEYYQNIQQEGETP